MRHETKDARIFGIGAWLDRWWLGGGGIGNRGISRLHGWLIALELRGTNLTARVLSAAPPLAFLAKA